MIITCYENCLFATREVIIYNTYLIIVSSYSHQSKDDDKNISK